jgi:hypothetical protein
MVIRVPAIAIRLPKALARKSDANRSVVLDGAETEFERSRGLAAAERRKEEILTSAALDVRLFI